MSAKVSLGRKTRKSPRVELFYAVTNAHRCHPGRRDCESPLRAQRNGAVRAERIACGKGSARCWTRVGGVVFGLLMIVGLAVLGASAKPASTGATCSRAVHVKPSGYAHASTSGSNDRGPATSAPAAVAAPPRAPSAAGPRRRRAPAAPPTVQAPAQPAPVSKPPPPPPAKPGCYPLSNEGTCYEPGEYCRKADHGTSGVAGDGEAITCEDNDGWRWEPPEPAKGGQPARTAGPAEPATR